MRKVYTTKNNGISRGGLPAAGSLYIYWSGMYQSQRNEKILGLIAKESNKDRIDIVLAGEGLIEW